MADQSKIEWTDATWNPVTGCTKISAADLARARLAAAGQCFELLLLVVGQFDDVSDVHASSSDGVAGCEIMD